MQHATRISWVLAGALACSAVHADQAACDRIQAANVKTGSAGVQMKVSGYDFARETPKLYAFGTQKCTQVRDEAVDGQPARVYREEYRSEVGSTDALIWISKTSGLVLREEQDGDIAGKGKGHISYHWAAAAKSPAAVAGSVKDTPPLYPHGHDMNSELPSTAAARGALILLETGDPVTTVDRWYASNTTSCARTSTSGRITYACSGGSITISSQGGKTHIALVTAAPPAH